MIIPHLYFSSKVVILINTETNEEVVDKKDEKIVTLFKLRTNMPQVRQGKPVNHEGESFCSSIIHLFKSKLFILSLLIRTCLIAMQSTLQYWTPDYMTKVINIEDHSYMKLFSNLFIIVTI